MTVTIKNPAENGVNRIGAARAEKLVRLKRAVWVSATVIKLLTDHHSHQSDQKIRQVNEDRRTAAQRDRIDQVRDTELPVIPVARIRASA